MSNEELVARKLGDRRREPIVVTEVPEEFVEEMKAVSKQGQNDACISSAEREQVRPEVKAATESQPTVKEEDKA